MTQLVLACIAFVSTHLLLSHPLRAPLVGRIGEGPFLLVYSLVAFATLGWMVFAYRALPDMPPAWVIGDIGWGVATAVMWLASILLAGSLVKNPAAPDPTGRTRPPEVARGVYAITRHPMMWSFMLWALIHIAVWPAPGNIAVALAVFVLALVGSRAQDAKKRALMGDAWAAWQARTSWVPFAALASGRARWADAVPGIGILISGTAIWLLATWAHGPLGGMVAGVWRWL